MKRMGELVTHLGKPASAGGSVRRRQRISRDSQGMQPLGFGMRPRHSAAPNP